MRCDGCSHRDQEHLYWTYCLCGAEWCPACAALWGWRGAYLEGCPSCTGVEVIESFPFEAYGLALAEQAASLVLDTGEYAAWAYAVIRLLQERKALVACQQPAGQEG